MKWIYQMLKTHQKIIKYGICSIASAMVELVVGWGMLRTISSHILVANTVSIVIGAVAHYFLTLLFVFHQKNDWKSVAAYIATFLFGMLLQNGIIWIFYDVILEFTPQTIRYVLSKGLSLVIPFIAIYHVRNFLNAKLMANQKQ